MKSRLKNGCLVFEPLEPRVVLSHPAAGDANSDYVFDQRDLLQVLEYGKYDSGQAATWEEGDWNGDGRFDRLDLVAAMQTSRYLAASAGSSIRHGRVCSPDHENGNSSHSPMASGALTRLADQVNVTHTAVASGRWSDVRVWGERKATGGRSSRLDSRGCVGYCRRSV